MYDNDFSNLGRQIQETVQNAVESMNYDRLNQTINQTVNQALDEARIYKEKVRRQYEESQKRQADNLRKQAQANQQSNVYQTNYARPVGKKQINMVLAPKIKKGTARIVAGTILSIVGCGDYRSAGYKDLFRDDRYSKSCRDRSGAWSAFDSNACRNHFVCDRKSLSQEIQTG